jgi:quercetin dioxygenase-like cupin family protein
MDIKRNGSRPSRKQPPENFAGNVRSDPGFEAGDPVRVRGATVTFEPGARTNWHTHPIGQTLIVLSGCGWVQSWGKPRQVINPGDIVWFGPGEKHWHGATDTTAMSHLAIVEHDKNGKSADWLERVTDEQYKSG